MNVKVIGFDLTSFPDKKTGELIEGSRVYYENLSDEEGSTAEYGNSCGDVFVKNCIPLSVGGIYEAVLKSQRKDGRIIYSISGFSRID